MKQIQLKLSERELDRLRTKIWNDFQGARSNHEARIRRFRRYYRMWRGLQETMGDKDVGPDFQVPMMKWVTKGQWSRFVQALLGDDAEIVATPTAPTDEKIGLKVGHYETWRWFEYMKATGPLATWVFRSVLFGRAHAEMTYEQEYYWERPVGKDGQPTGEPDEEKLCYDGPRITPLWPTELIVPAQDNCFSVNDYEWKIRRFRVTPQQLLDGERKGKYQGIRDKWEQIMAFAQQRQERDASWDDEKLDLDEAEGVDHSSMLGNRDSLECWAWYGKWRLPKGKQDARENNLDRRQDTQSDLLVKMLPHVQMVIGVQDLRDIYPRMRRRHPFLDIGLVKDGSYWCPGLGELLEDIQNESTINHALFRKAGMLSVGPVVFYKPSSGLDPETFEYKPGVAIPTEDPGGVNVVEMKADLAYAETMQVMLKTFAELLTGQSDNSSGLSLDRPNAPRTASGQAMLLQEGNTLVSLDMTMLREDLSTAIEYSWALDREYSDEEVFFRVTEEDAGGLYDLHQGFGTMTAEEREHGFDFELKFATSVYGREAKKQAILALYQLSIANPLVQQNPRALWLLLNKIWDAFGEKNFKAIIPQPPETDAPKQPAEEWALVLKGEEVHVTPLDDDTQHIIDHRRRLEQEMNLEEDRRDQNAEHAMVVHIMEHEHQRRQKLLLQALAQHAVEEMRAQQGPGAQPFPGNVPLQLPPQAGGAPSPGPQGGMPMQAAALAGPSGVGGPG